MASTYSYEYENIGRIPKSAALPSTIALYIIALIAAILRGFVRWHYGQLRLIDDGMVIFSVACMTVSFGLYMAYLGDIYITEALIYETFKYLGQFGNFLQIAVDIQVFSTAYIVISVTGIFAIKFSFLFFFRHLIDRIHKLQIYWRVVAIYTLVAWIISICIAPIACPFYDTRAIQCAQGPYFRRAFDVAIALLAFDISTDLLIISIPIILIRKIKIPLKSKIYLGTSLCLSCVMIVVAILQGATITHGGVEAIDVAWELYFQFVEVAVAILVVSVTAFRTLFIGHRAKNSRPSTNTPPHKKWYSSDPEKRVWNKMRSKSGTTMTDDTYWSQQEMPLSNGPLPSMVQPTRTHSGGRTLSSQKMPDRSPSDRRISERRISERKYSDRETGLSSHPTTYGGNTMVSNSDPEPFIAGTLSGPMMDMPMALPVQTPPEGDNPMETRPRRPRSDISAERRVSYWQRMIRSGIQRAQAGVLGRSASRSPEGRPDTRSPRYEENGVSPIGPSPERSPVRETV